MTPSPRVERDGGASAGAVLQLIRSGRATSRRQIAACTGLAPSTAALRVETLLDARLIEETGDANPRGGRTPRTLRVRADAGLVAAVVLNAHASTLALADMTGTIVSSGAESFDLARGPEVVIELVHAAVAARLDRADDASRPLRAITIGLPAPIDRRRRRTTTSTQLPGWENADLEMLWRSHSSAICLLENDANLLALAVRSSATDPMTTLAVKLDDRIGAGVLIDDRLFVGARGAAGEISHSSTKATSAIECACGVDACLESVASGAAISAKLQHAGYRIESLTDLITLAAASDPFVTEILREAGRLIGSSLSEVLNFLNPDEVVLGGRLANVPVVVSAVRGEIHRLSLPIVSDRLVVRAIPPEFDAETAGGVRRALDEILDPPTVDRLLRTPRPH